MGLLVAFVLTEAYVVHINVGKHAHSFSFSDVPTAVGLFLLPPAGLLSAKLVGAAVSLLLVRRQRPVKLAFNLAQLALGTTAGLVVWTTFGETSISSQRSWISALLTLIIVAFVSTAAV